MAESFGKGGRHGSHKQPPVTRRAEDEFPPGPVAEQGLGGPMNSTFGEAGGITESERAKLREHVRECYRRTRDSCTVIEGLFARMINSSAGTDSTVRKKANSEMAKLVEQGRHVRGFFLVVASSHDTDIQVFNKMFQVLQAFQDGLDTYHNELVSLLDPDKKEPGV